MPRLRPVPQQGFLADASDAHVEEEEVEDEEDCDSGLGPLPDGWDMGTDTDGKRFYIDHNTKRTTWVDPRDRLSKPRSFEDCLGNELPYGWEEAYHPLIGQYFINHLAQTNQIEDPRLKWREAQERMLKEYLADANQDLAAKKEIYTVKRERLHLAHEEVEHLNDTLARCVDVSSRTSLNSGASSSCSVGSKYDPELLRAEVTHARNRVQRLKQELEQIHSEMSYTERGLQALSMVEDKMGAQQSVYNVDEAQAMVANIRSICQSLSSGEKEKRELIRSLARLKDDVMSSRSIGSGGAGGGSSADLSISLPQERINTASQTDLSGESNNPWSELVRLRLSYNEARNQVGQLQQALVDIESRMIPGQATADVDRLLLIAEKEQLLRELRSIGLQGRSVEEVNAICERIGNLERDLWQVLQPSNQQLPSAERLRLSELKCNVLERLTEAARTTALLEAEIRNLSLSATSMSSNSSLGSQGSLSASSKGSQSSMAAISYSDIYALSGMEGCLSHVAGRGGSSGGGYSGFQQDVDLSELHRRVDRLLQGHREFTTIPEDYCPDINRTGCHLNHRHDPSSHHDPSIGRYEPISYNPSGYSTLPPQQGYIVPDDSALGGSIILGLGSSPAMGGAVRDIDVIALPSSGYTSTSSSFDLGPPPSYEQHQLRQVTSANSLQQLANPDDQQAVNANSLDQLSSVENQLQVTPVNFLRQMFAAEDQQYQQHQITSGNSFHEMSGRGEQLPPTAFAPAAPAPVLLQYSEHAQNCQRLNASTPPSVSLSHPPQSLPSSHSSLPSSADAADASDAVTVASAMSAFAASDVNLLPFTKQLLASMNVVISPADYKTSGAEPGLNLCLRPGNTSVEYSSSRTVVSWGAGDLENGPSQTVASNSAVEYSPSRTGVSRSAQLLENNLSRTAILQSAVEYSPGFSLSNACGSGELHPERCGSDTTCDRGENDGVAPPLPPPPLSPISESSSGLCNNVYTRSVSAAQSEESVTRSDSGVFETSNSTAAALANVRNIGPSSALSSSRQYPTRNGGVPLMSLQTAQVFVKLQYDRTKEDLLVELEQARHLSALPLPQHCHIYFRLAVQPPPSSTSPPPVMSTNLVSSDSDNPYFMDSLFLIHISQERLYFTSLQVNCYSVHPPAQSTVDTSSLNNNRQEHCWGGALVSLSPLLGASGGSGGAKRSGPGGSDVIIGRRGEVSNPLLLAQSGDWYNILSFKFIHPSPSSSSSSSPSSQPKNGGADVHRRSYSVGEAMVGGSRHLPPHGSSSTGGGLGSGQGVKQEGESSDESTVISSQTSTLTRDHGPDEMSGHGGVNAEDVVAACDNLTAGRSLVSSTGGTAESDEDDNEDVDGLKMYYSTLYYPDSSEVQYLLPSPTSVGQVEGVLDYYPPGGRGSNNAPHHQVELVLCDKETNTDRRGDTTGGHVQGQGRRLVRADEEGVGSGAAGPTRGSSIRRWQTFSPTVAGISEDDYRCRLSRSGSDNSVRQRRGMSASAAGPGQFDRQAFERQSVRRPRHRKIQSLVSFHGGGGVSRLDRHAGAGGAARTSIDLELDLQAVKVRQSMLNEEISSLRELKRRLQESKEKGDVEMVWMSEELQQFLLDTDRLLPRHERRAATTTTATGRSCSNVEETVQRRMRRVKQEVSRLQASTSSTVTTTASSQQQQDVNSFRKKMAFFTTMSSMVPPLDTLHSSPSRFDHSTPPPHRSTPPPHRSTPSPHHSTPPPFLSTPPPHHRSSPSRYHSTPPTPQRSTPSPHRRGAGLPPNS